MVSKIKKLAQQSVFTRPVKFGVLTPVTNTLFSLVSVIVGIIIGLNLLLYFVFTPFKDIFPYNKTAIGSNNLYFRDNFGFIYYRHSGGSMIPTPDWFQRVKSADGETFIEVSCGRPPQDNCVRGYGKDKNNLYYQGEIVPDTDLKTF